MNKGKSRTSPNVAAGSSLILRLSIALFLLATVGIAILQVLPWSASLAIVEIPLHYLPKWLPLLLLLPALWFWRQVLRLPKIALLLVGGCLVYLVLQYMGFVLPLQRLAADAPASNLRVLSANLIQVDAVSFRALLRSEQPDVIVTQEIQHPALAQLLADVLSADLDAGGAAWRLHCEHKLCLASRHPFTFVEAQSRRFRGGWGVMGAAYDMTVYGEPLRVFNVHLETVRKGFEGFSLSRQGVDSILQNANNRKIEAELLASWVGEQSPAVVVGDFNMTVGESLYREYFGELRNAFSEVGLGLGHTKSTRLLGVRIDHLVSTLDVLPVAARVGMDVGSDHQPLLVDLVLGH